MFALNHSGPQSNPSADYATDKPSSPLHTAVSVEDANVVTTEKHITHMTIIILYLTPGEVFRLEGVGRE